MKVFRATSADESIAFHFEKVVLSMMMTKSPGCDWKARPMPRSVASGLLFGNGCARDGTGLLRERLSHWQDFNGISELLNHLSKRGW